MRNERSDATSPRFSMTEAGRDAIFISHANPEDNSFTLWLATPSHGPREISSAIFRVLIAVTARDRWLGHRHLVGLSM